MIEAPVGDIEGKSVVDAFTDPQSAPVMGTVVHLARSEADASFRLPIANLIVVGAQDLDDAMEQALRYLKLPT